MRRLRHDRSDRIIRQQIHPDFVTNHVRCFTPQNIHPDNCFDESAIHFDKSPFRVKLTKLLSCNLFWIKEGGSNDFSIDFDLAYCGRTNAASRPQDVTALVQYGGCIRAMAGYQKNYRFVPLGCIGDFFEDIFGHRPTEAIILGANATCAESIKPASDVIKELVTNSRT